MGERAKRVGGRPSPKGTAITYQFLEAAEGSSRRRPRSALPSRYGTEPGSTSSPSVHIARPVRERPLRRGQRAWGGGGGGLHGGLRGGQHLGRGLHGGLHLCGGLHLGGGLHIGGGLQKAVSEPFQKADEVGRAGPGSNRAIQSWAR